MLKKGALFLAIPALIAFMQSPMFEDLKKWVVDTLIPALKNLVDIIVPIAQKLGAWVSDSLLPEFFDMLKKHWDSLTTMVSGIVDKVKVLFGPDATWNERIGALLGIFDDIGTFVYDAVRNLGVMILNLFGVDGGALAKKYWDPIAKFFGDIVDSVIEIFTDPVAGIKKLLGTIWNAASGVGKFLYDKLLAPFFTWIGEKLAFIPAGIAGMWTSVTDTVKEVWDSVVAWFEGLWTWASEGIAGTWTGIVDFVKTQFDGVITFLTDLFTWPKTPLGFVTKLIDIILLPYNLVINFLRDIFGWGKDEEGKTTPFSLGTFIVDAILAVVTWIKEKFLFAAATVVEGWTNLKTFISDAALAIKDWFVDKFTFAKDAAIAGWDGLLGFVTGAVGNIKTWFTDKFSFAKDTVIAGWDGLLGFVTGAVGNIKQYFWDDDGKSGILQFENPLSDFDPIQMIKDVITKIKDFFWKGDGTDLLEFELFGNIKLPDLSDILPDFTNPFAGLYDKIQGLSFFEGARDEWSSMSPIDSIKGILKRAFTSLFGPEKEGASARAGGMIKPGQWAIVGEEGPELVKFKPAGVVANNKQMMAGQDFAMNAMRQSMISQPPAGAGGGGSSTVMITNAPSTSNVANTKVETAAGVSDPHTQLAGVY